MANCLVIRHVAPEPAWAIHDALARSGVGTDVRRTLAGDPVPPESSDHDGVVVMGGPMSAGTDGGLPGRRAEATGGSRHRFANISDS